MMRSDAIRDLIQRLLEAAQREGTFTEAVALQVEREFRSEYRGDTIYVKEEIKSAPPVDEIQRRYLAGEPIDDIARGAGISRRTMYRLLKRRTD